MVLLAAPLVFLALQAPRGEPALFTTLMAAGCALLYAYYSAVYATVQDVIEPSLRGTAMALYFFAMYVIGASFGPAATGLLSDHFTRRAALAGGVTSLAPAALEPFRAAGLHAAMFVIPLLAVLLTLVLLAGSRTVTRDAAALQEWMRDGD
jgi:MFS family permease